jgi:cytochrome c7-like protein/class III cytochrome C family protein
MGQLFQPKADAIFRVVIALAALAFGGALALALVYPRSDAAWNVGRPAQQPIPFRHDLHAGTLALDCRHCHHSVERTARAGMPTAQMCMSCHSQIWIGAGVLEPLRTSLELEQPIRWVSVHRLPDHAYFHHGIHVSNGLACATCHGHVERMARTVKTQTLSMGWCLDCHRGPGPRTALGAAGSARVGAGPAPQARDLELAAMRRLTDCSTCHR